jgi:hypothetical protein
LFKENLMFLHFQGSTVTLSGFAMGEYLPLPRSKGGAFPSLLTLGGCPAAAAKFVQKHQVLLSLKGRGRIEYLRSAVIWRELIEIKHLVPELGCSELIILFMNDAGFACNA